MKKLTITLTDAQYTAYLEHLQRGQSLNLEEETFSGFSLTLNESELGAWLEMEMYGKLDLGEVTWGFED